MGILSSRFSDGGALTDPNSDFLKGIIRRARSTWTGRAVDETSALSFAPYYACIRVLADTISMLPRAVFKENGERRIPVSSHPVSRVLSVEANPRMSSGTWVQISQGHLGAWGNCYSEIIRNGRGEVVALWPLNPAATEPVVKDNKLFYRTTIDGKVFHLKDTDVLHIKGFGFDGYKGYSPIHFMAQAVALGQAAEEFAGKWFANGSQNGQLIKHPGKLSKAGADTVAAYWQESYAGLDEAHRIKVLQEGMEIQNLGIPPEDAQLLVQRQYQGHEIARYFRIPLHKLQYLDNATYSNIENQAIEFVTDTIQPWVTFWEQEINRRLFIGSERGNHYVKFNMGALLRGNLEAQAKYYQTACGGPWLTVDEVRSLQEFDSIGGGDQLRSPVNMQPQEQMGENLGEGKTNVD